MGGTSSVWSALLHSHQRRIPRRSGWNPELTEPGAFGYRVWNSVGRLCWSHESGVWPRDSPGKRRTKCYYS